MKGFRFRLEPVLQIRSHRLQRRRAELAAAYEKSALARAQVLQIDRAMREAGSRIDERLQRGVGSGELDALMCAADDLRVRRARLAEAARLADAEVDACRRKVTRAHMNLRSLELLRDKRLRQYRDQIARREQRELDETAQVRFARRRGTTP